MSVSDLDALLSQGRKHVQAMKQEKKAALAIQKSYRGHKGRKQVEDMKRQRELQEAERKRLEQELAERRMQMAMEEDQVRTDRAERMAQMVFS